MPFTTPDNSNDASKRVRGFLSRTFLLLAPCEHKRNRGVRRPQAVGDEDSTQFLYYTLLDPLQSILRLFLPEAFHHARQLSSDRR
jgi:hypothetical protein